MKRIYFFIFTAVIVLITGLRTAAQNVDFIKENFPGRESEFKRAVQDYTLGNKYYDKELYLGAIEYFEKAYTFNPSNARLNYLLGDCYLKWKPGSEAIDYLKKSLAIDPEQYTNVKYLLAQVYHLEHNFDKALVLYQDYMNLLKYSEVPDLYKEVEKKVDECRNGEALIMLPLKIIIENPKDEFNSIFAEYSPVLCWADSSIFFTTQRFNTELLKNGELNVKYFEDIYTSKMIDGIWDVALLSPIRMNYNRHNASAGISPDGNTMFFYKGNNNGDLYLSERKDGKWNVPVSIGRPINTEFHESSASISPDGKTLYFVSDRPGGFGGRDIYVSHKDKKGYWSEPLNLGPDVNTAYDEEGVFLHPDGNILYFSSKGHNNMGGYDIFKSLKSDNDKWSEPVNIGYPINTSSNDVFYFESADGKIAYFSSDRPGSVGYHDIYIAKQPEQEIIYSQEIIAVKDSIEPEILIDSIYIAALMDTSLLAQHKEDANHQVPGYKPKITNNTLLRGKILDDATKLPLQGTIEVADNKNGEILCTYNTKSKTGEYVISLAHGRNYNIMVKAKGYLFHSENVIIPKDSCLGTIYKNFNLKRPEVGSSIVLNNIFFDYNKATLREESFLELARLVDIMNEYPYINVEISGHTDNVGSAVYNQTLSEKRAKAVVAYLVGKNIAAGRMTTVGYGFSKPIANNDSPEGRQLNRRVEFKIK